MCCKCGRLCKRRLRKGDLAWNKTEDRACIALNAIQMTCTAFLLTNIIGGKNSVMYTRGLQVGVPPNKLNEGRHMMLALFHASGMRNCDIAAELGYSDARVSVLLDSPLMKAQIAELRKKIDNSGIANALELINREVLPSVRTLVEIRDGAEESAQRRGAANDILDRHPQFSKKSSTDVEHTVKLVLSSSDLRQLVDGGSLPEGEKAHEQIPRGLSENITVIDYPDRWAESAADVLANGVETAYTQPALRTLAESIAAFEEAEA